jgi:thiosulfate reductase cytochrome b subunit
MDRGRNYLAHSPPIRIMHWIGATAVIGMISSGWEIYNASPLLPFTFPRWMTLGGWLGGGIAWHLSAMWVLFDDGLAYLAYGILSGHFRRDILPPRPKIILRDLDDALQFRLGHQLGSYNGVQRLLRTYSRSRSKARSLGTSASKAGAKLVNGAECRCMSFFAELVRIALCCIQVL